MKDAYYFSHDSNARNDPKIQALMSKWGYEGYGWWWAVLETLRDQPGYRYPLNKYTYGAFARMFCTTQEKATEFLSDCCHEFVDEKGGLLIVDEQFLWSEAFSRRMQTIDAKREQAREAANARHGKNARDTSAMREQCVSNADALQGKERKGKESIEKESIEKESSGRSAPRRPTVEEVKAYCVERQNNVNPQKWYDHYSSNGWKVGKNPMKDWKAAVRTWENSDIGGKNTRGDINYGTVQLPDFTGTGAGCDWNDDD